MAVWMWQEQDDPTREWGMIVATVESDAPETIRAVASRMGLRVWPLAHRSLEVVEMMRPLAEAQHHASGRPVRLVRLEVEEVVEVLYG